MKRIPNYLKTLTNKYRGLITEKAALNFLREEGFSCSRWMSVLVTVLDIDRRVENLGVEEYYTQQKNEKKERCERELEKYSSVSPPWEGWLGSRGSVEITWDEYRREMIDFYQGGLENLESRYLSDMEREIESRRIWEDHFKSIKKYRVWLREEGHYRPDFIAKKNGKPYLVEVKSQNKGKVAPLHKHQRKALLKARDFGLTPLILVVPINLNPEVGEPKLENITD